MENFVLDDMWRGIVTRKTKEHEINGNDFLRNLERILEKPEVQTMLIGKNIELCFSGGDKENVWLPGVYIKGFHYALDQCFGNNVEGLRNNVEGLRESLKAYVEGKERALRDLIEDSIELYNLYNQRTDNMNLLYN